MFARLMPRLDRSRISITILVDVRFNVVIHDLEERRPISSLSIIPSKKVEPARLTPSLYKSKLLNEPAGNVVVRTNTPS